MESTHQHHSVEGKQIEDVGKYQQLEDKLVYATITKPDFTSGFK